MSRFLVLLFIVLPNIAESSIFESSLIVLPDSQEIMLTSNDSLLIQYLGDSVVSKCELVSCLAMSFDDMLLYRYFHKECNNFIKMVLFLSKNSRKMPCWKFNQDSTSFTYNRILFYKDLYSWDQSLNNCILEENVEDLIMYFCSGARGWGSRLNPFIIPTSKHELNNYSITLPFSNRCSSLALTLFSSDGSRVIMLTSNDSTLVQYIGDSTVSICKLVSYLAFSFSDSILHKYFYEESGNFMKLVALISIEGWGGHHPNWTLNLDSTICTYDRTAFFNDLSEWNISSGCASKIFNRQVKSGLAPKSFAIPTNTKEIKKYFPRSRYGGWNEDKK